MPNHTIAENLQRLQTAKTAIGNAITAKGGTVGANDGLEEFASDIATIPSGGGVEFSNSPTDFSLVRNLRNLHVDVPSGVTSLSPTSFKDCLGLISINLPETVQMIDGYAFMNCSNLVNISMQNGITSLGDSVFVDCISIPSIELPSTLTTIGSHTFQHCDSLTSIEIPSSVTSIGNHAFTNCINLEKIYVNKPENSISGSPWNAPITTQIIWRTDRYQSSYTEVASGTTLTGTVNATVGDLVVATFEIFGSSYSISEGWTLLGDGIVTGSGNYSQKTGMAYKIAASTTETFTITQNTSTRAFISMVSITGASIGSFSGYTAQTDGLSITMNKPNGLTIWSASTVWWGTGWSISNVGGNSNISTTRNLLSLDQSNSASVTFTNNEATSPSGILAASLTITGIDNFWYYDE